MMSWRSLGAWFLFLVVVQSVLGASLKPHADNWALLICTSRYWFNYRHVSNVLSMYHTVKALGLPDSHIILMMADDMACNPRNPYSGIVYGDDDHAVNLYGENVEVDYRGEEVTVENALRILTGRHLPNLAPSKRMASHNGSNLLVYMSGHGGDGFLKFQDSAEMTSEDLADAIEEMNEKERFREALLIFDTCEAASLAQPLRTPGVAAIGSSRVGENSYAHGLDRRLGLALSDGFTFNIMRLLESAMLEDSIDSVTVGHILEATPYHRIHSHPFARTDLIGRSPSAIHVTDFFAFRSDVYIW